MCVNAHCRPLSTPATQHRLGLNGSVAIVGAPSARGQPKKGVELGPNELRSANLENRLAGIGWNVADKGDVVLKDGQNIGNHAQQLAREVHHNASEGSFVLTLGGDHSISIGSGAGALLARPDLGVLWVDAHADINTPKSSNSGNVHGMSVAFLMRLGEVYIPGFEWLRDIPPLLPQNIVYVGCRELDLPERQFLRGNNIKVMTMYEIDKYGIGKVMEMALDHLGDKAIHLSYDIDAIDPLYAPSTGTPVRGGLTWREGHFVAEEAAASGQLVSMDLVEVNPQLAKDINKEETVSLAVGLIASALGATIL